MVKSQQNRIELVTRPCPERGKENGSREAQIGSDVALRQPGFEQGRDQTPRAFGGGEFQPGPPGSRRLQTAQAEHLCGSIQPPPC